MSRLGSSRQICWCNRKMCITERTTTSGYPHPLPPPPSILVSAQSIENSHSKPSNISLIITMTAILLSQQARVFCFVMNTDETASSAPDSKPDVLKFLEQLVRTTPLGAPVNGSSEQLEAAHKEEEKQEADGLLYTSFDDHDENNGESMDTGDKGDLLRKERKHLLDKPDKFEEGDGFKENEDFYTRNPVDQSKLFYENSSSPASDFYSEIEINDKDFADFYNKAYRKFFDKTPVSGKPINRTRSVEEQRKPGLRDTFPSASFTRQRNIQQSFSSNYVGCAVMLSRGNCITLHMVESAIRMARKLLNYHTPEGLDSPEPSEATINAVGELVEYTTRVLAYQLQLTPEEVNFELEPLDTSRTSLWAECPLIFRQPPICQVSRYRTHTGRCNNPMGTHLGSTSMPFVRILPAAYSDGIGLPREFSVESGMRLPPVRLLSLSLHPDIENPSDDNSALFAAWGQLLNHDLAAASGAREGTGHKKPCCYKTRATFNSYLSRNPRDRVCMPIEIGLDDPLYAPFGIFCHEFKRSLAGLRPGCTLGPRVNINTITSFIDASFVYGSSYSMTQSLRSSGRGMLSVWHYFKKWKPPLKPLLPAQVENPDEECVNRRGRMCFLSGDMRTNQQIQLTVLHTLHTRQHNRLATALGFLNPHWSSDRIYHEARHIHIAMVQHILLNEYLPTLLGPHLCELYNLTEAPPDSYWDHYDPSINPGVRQAFAAAAFRQGHSTISSLVFRFNNLHIPTQVYRLRQLFRQPWPLFEPLAVDEFMLGMTDAPAQQVDEFMSADLSGHLLQVPGEPVGLDLAAINLQRGRDQGLPGYNQFREWCGLEPVVSFDDLENYMPNRTAQTMALLYESVDDIDLFAAGLSEYPSEESQLGPTFACIVGRQFQASRMSDRFWFESSTGPHMFTLDQLASIKQVTLARIICANSDNILTIQQMAMKLPHPILNPRYMCNELPDLDITQWFDPLGRG